MHVAHGHIIGRGIHADVHVHIGSAHVAIYVEVGIVGAHVAVHACVHAHVGVHIHIHAHVGIWIGAHVDVHIDIVRVGVDVHGICIHVHVDIHLRRWRRRRLLNHGWRRRRHWRWHCAEIEAVEGVWQHHDCRRHHFGCPVVLENRRHVVDWNHWEDDLNRRMITIGIPAPMIVEQHSQLISWFSLMFRLYCEERSFPEHVGLISALLGIWNCSLMALSPTSDCPA